MNWHDCYDESWKGIIVPEAFAHPAKFSKALIERIIDHGLKKDYWRVGSIIGDPFGGVGLGGIACAYRGLSWIGCELEPRFVALAEQNFALHKWKLEHIGKPQPRIIQGDSRKFAENLESGAIEGVISSPPYATIASGAGGLNTKPAKDGQQGGRNPNAASQDTDQRYGESEGQIARLKEGSIDSCITSPPFSAPNMQPCIGQGVRKDLVATGKSPENNYGTTEGQITTLKPGVVDSIVTSPPYEGTHVGAEDNPYANTGGKSMGEARNGHLVKSGNYAGSTSQIGNYKGETYWQAMALVYASCYTSMKPGGIFACVVKNYVARKQIVPLCDDTLLLLQHVGFVPLERIHAMLVKETLVNGFNGEVFTDRKERKSFFRRLAEKKGSPRIDFEEVLFVRKP